MRMTREQTVGASVRGADGEEVTRKEIKKSWSEYFEGSLMFWMIGWQRWGVWDVEKICCEIYGEWFSKMGRGSQIQA